MVSGWERIYRNDGDLGFEVLPKVVRASKAFKELNYHEILDLGCGTGRHSIFLAQQGFFVQAMDLSATGLAIAEQKAKSLNLHDIRFVQHEMKTIPFPDKSYDAVICTWTIYHGTLAEIQETLTEIRRVLKVNGALITDFLSTHDSTYGLGREIEEDTFVGQKPGEEDVPHHYSTRAELNQLLRGFRQVRVHLHSRRYTAEHREYMREYFDVEAVR